MSLSLDSSKMFQLSELEFPRCRPRWGLVCKCFYMEMFPGKLVRNCSWGNWESETEKGRDPGKGEITDKVPERVISAWSQRTPERQLTLSVFSTRGCTHELFNYQLGRNRHTFWDTSLQCEQDRRNPLKDSPLKKKSQVLALGRKVHWSWHMNKNGHMDLREFGHQYYPLHNFT